MGIKVSNNAYGTLAASLSDVATTLSLNSGEGARFPTLGGSDYFYLTLIDTSNNIEIVKVTARSSDTMTIVRGQDGTTARSYAVNSRAELRPVAALFDTKADVAYVDAQVATKLGYVAPGTSGNVLTSNGTDWVSQAISSYAGQTMVVFTSSGTWTPPAGITQAVFLCVGGGGGGTCNNGTVSYGRNGGNGGAALVSKSGLSGSYSITIGAGGNGTTSGPTGTASAGGTSSIAGIVSCTGGGGAVGQTASGADGAPTVSSGTAIRASKTFANIYATGEGREGTYGSGSGGGSGALAYSATDKYGAGQGGAAANVSSSTIYSGGGGIGGVVIIIY